MRKTLLTKQMKLQRKELLKWCNKGGYDDNVLKNFAINICFKKIYSVKLYTFYIKEFINLCRKQS